MLSRCFRSLQDLSVGQTPEELQTLPSPIPYECETLGSPYEETCNASGGGHNFEKLKMWSVASRC